MQYVATVDGFLPMESPDGSLKIIEELLTPKLSEDLDRIRQSQARIGLIVLAQFELGAGGTFQLSEREFWRREFAGAS